MAAPKLFGTDGVRGMAGSYPLDPPTIARLGAAIVRVRPFDRPARIVVGRDTRESGEWIERRLARGAASAGAVITGRRHPDAGSRPRRARVRSGVVLSRRQRTDNGIKVLSGRGEKFGDGEERAVEAAMADGSWVASARDADVTAAIFDVHRARPADPARRGPARGRASRSTCQRRDDDDGEDAVRTGGVLAGHARRPARRPKHQPRVRIDASGEAGSTVVVERRLGIAFYGDGDRAIFVDHRGHIVDGDAVLLMLGRHDHQQGRLIGQTIVATVMSNAGLEIALRDLGIKMVRTPVGDKHVMEEMMRGGFTIGGEQSGHVILADHLSTGDGMATALAVLRVMAETGHELADLAAQLKTLPQTLVNVRVQRKTPVADVPEIVAAIAASKPRSTAAAACSCATWDRAAAAGHDRGEDQASVQAWAEEIAEAARVRLG
jgi:phosphoglucosamine mutase